MTMKRQNARGRMQEAAHLDVFWIVVDNDRGLEDVLSQVALVLTGEINTPLHLDYVTPPHSSVTILHSCLLKDTLKMFVEMPEAAASTKKLQKGLGKVFDCKNSNNAGEAQSLNETKETQYTLPLGFSAVKTEGTIPWYTLFLSS